MGQGILCFRSRLYSAEHGKTGIDIDMIFPCDYMNYEYDLIQHCRLIELAHLSLDKMPAISQTLFSDVISWMKVLYFDLDSIEVCS